MQRPTFRVFRRLIPHRSDYRARELLHLFGQPQEIAQQLGGRAFERLRIEAPAGEDVVYVNAGVRDGCQIVGSQVAGALLQKALLLLADTDSLRELALVRLNADPFFVQPRGKIVRFLEIA